MSQKYLFFCQDVPYRLRAPRSNEPALSLDELWEEVQEKLRANPLTAPETEHNPGPAALQERAVEDPPTMWAALMQRCLVLDAGGGLIFSENKMLWILRHGRWDLPKGKAEPGESILETALRECREECGLVNLIPRDDHNNLETNHLYLFKGHVAWKRSSWFKMTCPMPGNERPVPQVEEGIVEVRWMGKDEVQATALPMTFPSIRALYEEAEAMKFTEFDPS
ncbi:MAG: NUDIX hydrolase [Bacteroidia bacterium]